MSRSDWRYLLTIGIAALIAAVAAGLIYGEASSLQGFYENEARENAHTYRKTTIEHAQRSCAAITGPERYNCVHEEYHSARDRERQEYDLQAQLVTSAWTRGMGLAALIGMFVGIVGVGLIYATLQETRNAAEAARNTHEAFVSVERAKLVFRDPYVNFAELGKGLKITVRVENVGKSSAVVTSVRWVPNNKPRFPNAGFQQQRHEYAILAGACGEVFDTYSAVDWHAQPFLLGYVEYSSAFSEGHRSYFCYRIEEAAAADAYGPARLRAVTMKIKTAPKDT